MNMPSILIVDDEVNNFDVIEAFLSDQAYQLHYAADGQKAINSLSLLQPDVILLDVMMPGMDGIEVCQTIKSMPQWKSIPIIILTALTAKEDLARCLKAGADDFMSKPVNKIELRARVHSMLRIKQQYDSIKTLSQLQADTINILHKNLNELRGNLVVKLPHELNTPLYGISGIIGLLLEEYDTMSAAEIYEFLTLAQKSVQRLENLIQKFLTYAQLDLTASNSNIEATNKINFQPISTQSVIENIAKEQAEKFQRTHDLVVNLVDVNVKMHPQDLQSIIVELLENSFKFSQPGTPVTIVSKLINNMFHLLILDQGQGMTAEQIANIGAFRQFERKFQEQQGLGLGLKIVKTIIENYGGVLSISSVYHQETTVHLTLPISPSLFN